jgi:hypothetical protein
MNVGLHSLESAGASMVLAPLCDVSRGAAAARFLSQSR